jgi:hypothetical protein
METLSGFDRDSLTALQSDFGLILREPNGPVYATPLPRPTESWRFPDLFTFWQDRPLQLRRAVLRDYRYSGMCPFTPAGYLRRMVAFVLQVERRLVQAHVETPAHPLAPHRATDRRAHRTL